MNDYRPRILCVDDDPNSLSLLEAMLGSHGFETVLAPRGKEALEIIRRERIDAVLLDVMMPDMDGFEVCRRIKSNECSRNLPVVMVTSYAARENRIMGIEAGAEDFISKPLDMEEIIARINMLLRVKTLNDQLLRMNDMLEEAVAKRTEALQTEIAERKVMQAQLIQQEKLASIGQLMAGIAHEINNPVGYVRSNLESLRKYSDRIIKYINYLQPLAERFLPDNVAGEMNEHRKSGKVDMVINDYRNLIDETIEGVERVKKIVLDLKTFSRKDAEERETVDINRSLESVLSIVWNEIKYVADLQRDFSPIPPVNGYPQKLGQVFLNLLVNASHAISEHGTITVRTWLEEGMVCVSISDTGCGIPPDVLPHIFEPFYTTKKAGNGTGLGLSICENIVRTHDGYIEVDSEIGKGATFTVRLPAREAGQE